MIWRLLLVLFATLVLSGCELFGKRNNEETPPVNTEEQANEKGIFCLSSLTEKPFEHNCDITYWLDYWSDIENKSWPQRKAEIDKLGQDNTATLKKVFLSQGRATPYRDRLRAQSWIEGLLPRMSVQMRNFMSVVVYQPSQELLEMESALVSLSRINTDLTGQNDDQKLVIEKQKNQIEQLLKIEASIMDNENGDNL